MKIERQEEAGNISVSRRPLYIRNVVGLRPGATRSGGLESEDTLEHERDVVWMQEGKETQTLHLNADVLPLKG